MDEMQLLEDAETRQESALQSFLTSVGEVARRFWSSIVDGLRLTEPSETVSKKDALRSNFRAVTQSRLSLRYQLTSSGYDDAVITLMDEMQDVTQLIESYYEPMNLSAQGGVYEQAARQAMTQTQAYLMETLPEVAFISPAEEILMDGIMHGSSQSEISKRLRMRLVEDGLPERLAHQQAEEMLWRYHRNYSTSLGKSLGLKHYYYDGVIASNTRRFCEQRARKAYTEKEIQSWAALDWQGKIPGTTKESIFWLAGGYRCKHVIRPITQKLYKQLSEIKE